MANTVINISTSGQTYTLPGTHWTQAQVVTTFSTNVPGIGSMDMTQTENGEDVIMTFRPRTGTKGLTS